MLGYLNSLFQLINSAATMVFHVDFAVSVLNWIQTVWHSDGIPEKKLQTTKKYEKKCPACIEC